MDFKLGDRDNERYQESYFDHYPGIWKHGDWIKIDGEGRCIIYGRSDSTINRSGVRMGTSDLYRVIASVDDVFDSLVIDLEMIGQTASLLLFVVLTEGAELDENLANQIFRKLLLGFDPDKVINPDSMSNPESLPFFTVLAKEMMETNTTKLF